MYHLRSDSTSPQINWAFTERSSIISDILRVSFSIDFRFNYDLPAFSLIPVTTLLVQLFLAGLTSLSRASDTPNPHDSHHELSLSDLEERLRIIDQQLQMLAQPSMRSGVGSIGYRSMAFDEAETTVEVSVELEQPTVIDQVILVPAIWRDTTFGFRADGFPIEFRIVAGTDNDLGHVIAHYGSEDGLLPRIAPVVINFPPQKASWVRLEATQLSARAWDKKFILQLSEIFVFSKNVNVALHQAVEASSSAQWLKSHRKKRYLVDGFTPYLMNAFGGEQSVAFVSSTTGIVDPSLTIDLEAVREIEQIHLHSTDLSDTIPQSSPEDFGIPKRLIIEGAKEENFSDAIALDEYAPKSTTDTGPIIMRRFPKTACRYVRLRCVEPYLRDLSNQEMPLIGFAEVEVFSEGVNVALGGEFNSNFPIKGFGRKLSALTDGNNLFGQVLPIRLWMNELSQRHDLEVQRPIIVAELNRRYAQQSTIIRRLIWLVAVLGLVSIVVMLIGRIRRQRAINRTREQIAADLHDELGANLHALSLLTDIAQANRESPKKMDQLLQRIRALSQRSGAAARYCSNLIESKGLFENLVLDMKRTSDRLMADLDHEITIQGEEHLQNLAYRSRIDLFLFYKECLVNILRHSDATQASTLLIAEPSKITLTVTDNGRGLLTQDGTQVPKSLSRRARFMGAQAITEDLGNKGTKIVLQWRTRQISRWTSKNNS